MPSGGVRGPLSHNPTGGVVWLITAPLTAQSEPLLFRRTKALKWLLTALEGPHRTIPPLRLLIAQNAFMRVERRVLAPQHQSEAHHRQRTGPCAKYISRQLIDALLMVDIILQF